MYMYFAASGELNKKAMIEFDHSHGIAQESWTK
jgi:hypothetical protein